MEKVKTYYLAGIIALVLLYLLIRNHASGNDATSRAIVAKWGKDVFDASRYYGIPAKRIFAMVYRESEGDEQVSGKAGEVGLMQIRKIAWNELVKRGYVNGDFSQIKEGRTNIFAGTAYLKCMLNDAKGDLSLATKKYNGNPESEKAKQYLVDVLKFEMLFSTII